jgi:prophage regulatory protein
MKQHHQLPETGYLRLWQIVGDPKATPPIPALIPISRSSWWEGVRRGRYPRSHKLGPRTTVWKVEDILALIKRTASPGSAA